MKNITYSTVLAVLTALLLPQVRAEAPSVFDYSITNNYLNDLQPEVIELSAYDKVRLPGVNLTYEMVEDESLVIKLESEKKPWPSWWYPSHGGELFNSINIEDKKENEDFNFQPPLFVYDFWFGQDNSSLEYLEKEFVPNASWSGACTLWAFSSVYDEQPNKTLCLRKSAVDNKLSYSRITDNTPGSDQIKLCELSDGVVIYPGHLKALLALSYRRLSERKRFFNDFIFGQLNTGSGFTDIRDIFPHEFISVLQFQLGVKKFPVIIDTDLSEAIWNHPIYNAKITLTKKNDTTLSALIVVDYASPLNEGLGVLERLNDMVSSVELEQSTVRKLYKAELYGTFNGDQFEVKTDGFRFERSAWVADSINDHPDIVMAPPKLNAEQMEQLQKQVLTELLGAADDVGKRSIRAEVDFFNIKTLLNF